MAISTRTRFEVFKRDGFRCRYCGANAASVLLHVDHALAIANGGSDDPANLVTACAECNLGKSDVPLEEPRLAAGAQLEAMREHAEQMREYMAAVRELEAARNELVQMVIDRWMDVVDSEGMQRQLINQLPGYIDHLGLETVVRCVDAVGAAWNVNSASSQRKYFLACLRNAGERRGA